MLTDTRRSPFAAVSPIEGTRWIGGLWKEVEETVFSSTVPHLRNMFDAKDISHVVENFRIAAGEAEGDFDGTVFGDGDFYKWMESAMYAASRTEDDALFRTLDAYIDLIARAQQPDGYLSTKQIIGEKQGRGPMRQGDINDFEVYNDFDRNLVNLFRCMKERTMATIRELGFCNLNSREDFIAIRKFFDHETFDDRFLTEELMLTEIMLPPPEAAELKEIRMRITEDHDVRRAAMFLKLLRNSYSSSGKSFASQPFDIRKLFGLIQELEDRMANVVIENQDFETLIRHYDRPDAFFYADPPYFSTEDMYEVGFGWDDHVRLRETLGRIKGKFLLSYNDCPEIRELYDGFSLFDFSRTHSMAQRYEAGKEFKELLIANYDYYERENAKPKQLTLFDIYGDENYDYEKILKESIISCKIR